MHARQILADYPEREQLRSGEYGDHRGEEGEPRYRIPLEDPARDDVCEDGNADGGESEASQAGDLERPSTEAGRHVHCMRNKLSKVVVRLSIRTRVVADSDRA